MKNYYIRTSGDDEKDAIKNLQDYLSKDYAKLDPIKDTERLQLMDDTLDACVEQAKEEVQDYIKEYLQENPDTNNLDSIDDDGRIHEIIDGCVPIYNKELDDNYYINQFELDEAWENAGLYATKAEDNNYTMTAHYCYISDKVWEYIHEISENLEEYTQNK